jgi:hypothetical protein
MYHGGNAGDQHSLFGLPPICSHDLLFLGWIRPNEVDTVRLSNFSAKNFSDIKLADINTPLTQRQIDNGYRRIIKVMINEKFENEHKDEYFLIEYHKATGFDKAFENYDEYATNGYNKGILIWHVKETANMMNQFSDDILDVVTAAPYNGWNGNPIPHDNYPRNYTNRPANFNGKRSGDYNYLDDFIMTDIGNNHGVYDNPPDGGRTLWAVTTAGEKWGWYPGDPTLYPRQGGLRSDFFTDEVIKGYTTNRITDATRPSTKTWGGKYGTIKNALSEKTHIAITDIRRVNDYMQLNVYYNYYEGDITENTTFSGNVRIGADLTVASGTTLSIKPGTIISMLNNSSLIIKGTINSEADPTTPVTVNNGIIILEGGEASNSNLKNFIFNNGARIQRVNGANAKRRN